ESGFDRVILISASYGLGEALVQGKVNPDEFYVSKEALANNHFSILKRELGDKTCKMIYTTRSERGASTKLVRVNKKEGGRFCLTDNEIQLLAKQAMIIENYYQKPMDIEWAKDGLTGEFFILQARPETVKSLASNLIIENYVLNQSGPLMISGQGIGQKIACGRARVILDPKKMHELQAGEILITDMTDPDWEPVLKKAAGIVTNRGGRTCHAAIIARELMIPAVIGCNKATQVITSGDEITLSCADGNIGHVYAGKLAYHVEQFSVEALKPLPTKLCLNIGHPEKAFALQALPNEGVGLARIEFIISNSIGIHPKALLEFASLPDKLKNKINKLISAYAKPDEFYIEKLREGMATIAAAFYPKPVIFRFSDFKSNEYRNLLGGHLFEPIEENPMLGFRGASRYQNTFFKECFILECEALKRVRDQMGLTNACIMVPFVRTVAELENVLALMAENGLKRGKNDLKIFMMCEIPSNALLAREFLKEIDGFSIGSNDLTQLTLGLDRDSSLIADQFDEANPSVKYLIKAAIDECKRQEKYIGICGQAPSDNLAFANWLIQEGIGAISLNPDCVVKTWSALLKMLS
ncbi:MAG: phosphoenolpyruvate synthase, partial [Gammaproteobacteria bacterium]|nr:phosphoenolpyruvate synthase [Gammaproteobacteria bacterium]